MLAQAAANQDNYVWDVIPLLTLNSDPSPHVEAVCAHLEKTGKHFAIETVPYEFQRGGNQMLRAWTA